MSLFLCNRLRQKSAIPSFGLLPQSQKIIYAPISGHSGANSRKCLQFVMKAFFLRRGRGGRESNPGFSLFSLHLAIFIKFGYIWDDVSGHIMKNNLAIWSHWLFEQPKPLVMLLEIRGIEPGRNLFGVAFDDFKNGYFCQLAIRHVTSLTLEIFTCISRKVEF